MTPFVLYFDIGNTNIKVGLTLGTRPVSVYALPTDERLTADSLGLSLLEIVRREGATPEACEACQ